MILADFILPQSNIEQKSNTMENVASIDEFMKVPKPSSESKPINDDSSSITSFKIPLVSFEPILATSPNYILVNEFTRRRNQLVLFNDQFQRLTMRSTIKQPLIDELWYENQQVFLLLTDTEIYQFDPNTMMIDLLPDLIPIENKTFKCFTFLNQSILLTAYNEWGADYIDRWQQDNDNGHWKLIDKLSLSLTPNEFIGNMITIIEDDCVNLAITIYNNLTEQWRIDLRNIETFKCNKSILLPGPNVAHDYRLISVKNVESNVKLLIFSSTNTNIIAIDSQWKKIKLNYTHPVQRMALFQENYVIVRTKERVDIHSFQ